MAKLRSRPVAKSRQSEMESPIYVEIQREIGNNILSGKWPPGHRIPPESELVTTYNCSRMTVNKALSNLVAAGLIIRRTRSGSTVATRLAEPLLSIQDIRAEVLSLGRTYRFKIVSRSVHKITNAADATHIGVSVGTPMLVIEALHFAGDEPFAMEFRQINLAAAPNAQNADFSKIPPGTWLLEEVAWTEGEHSLRAISADQVMAKSLHVDRGAACMSLTRRTWKGVELITFVRLLYPGDRHRFILRFSPSGIQIKR
jgi:GntR family histidine utilization transcriptional repressor